MSTADSIIAECAIAFRTSSEDCNRFAKAVAEVFFEPDLFTGPGMTADAIVRELRSSAAWADLEKNHARAISQAKAGKFVIAGMTSAELSSDHGHLAIVVGNDGQNSGSVLVPICYAGSIKPTARVQRKRVSETFGATVAREGRISYYSRDVETIPSTDALNRLLAVMSGSHDEPTTVPAKVPAKKSRKPRRKRQ